MDCLQTEWTDRVTFLNKFNRRVIRDRIPTNGSMELTHRCNLNCIHCYLRPVPPNPEELDTGKFLRIIDEITDAGCLSLLITGGEPMLRSDFAQIYTHARKKGLIVSVFSNGTLINDEILDLFSSLPPWNIEISLYGATAETYEKITGVEGSFDRCMKGILALKQRNIRLKIKTLLMKPNQQDLLRIKKFADDLNLVFRFDGELFPRMNGDQSPVLLRLSPKDLVNNEFQMEGKLQEWVEYYEKRKELIVPRSLYGCSAGQNSFHVDPSGNLYPCIMVKDIFYPLTRGDFKVGWRELSRQLEKKQTPKEYRCTNCRERVICTTCPPYSLLETGKENQPSNFLCRIAKLRFEKISEACYIKDDDEREKNKKTQATLSEANTPGY